MRRRDSARPPPARPALPDFGPERVQGRPRSHSPGGAETAAAGIRIRAHPQRGRCGGSPRAHLAHPGASGSIAPAGAGSGPGRAAAGRRRPSHRRARSGRRGRCASRSAPPPWNSDPARSGRVGPRALKGAAQLSARQSGLGEEPESETEGGRGGVRRWTSNPVCDEKAWHSRPGAEARPGLPGDPTGPDVPSPHGLVPPVPSTLLDLLERDLGASHCTPSPAVASLEKASLPVPQRNSGSDGGWGAAKSPPAGVDLSLSDKRGRLTLSGELSTRNVSLGEREDGPCYAPWASCSTLNVHC